LIEDKSLDKAKEIARQLGFSHEPGRMLFKDGAIKIERLVKIDQEIGEELPLALLIVTSEIKEVWESRVNRMLDWGEISVVSQEGLIRLKELRNSGTDQDDVKKLRGEVDANWHVFSSYRPAPSSSE